MVLLFSLSLSLSCFIAVWVLSKNDRKQLEKFKVTNVDVYQKYKGAFDANPSDFSGVEVGIDYTEPHLLPEEKILFSYSIPRFYKRDINLYVLTDRRLIYTGYTLTKRETKAIQLYWINHIKEKIRKLGTEYTIKSGDEEIKIFFGNSKKEFQDEFLRHLNEKQIHSQLN